MAKPAGSKKFCLTCGKWVRPTTAGRCALCKRDLSNMDYQSLLTQQEELDNAEGSGGNE